MEQTDNPVAADVPLRLVAADLRSPLLKMFGSGAADLRFDAT